MRNAADVVAVPSWPRRWGGEGARLVAMDLEDQHTPGLRRRSAALRRYQCRTVRALLQGMRHHRSQTYTVMYPRQAGKNQVAAELISALLRRHSRDGGSLVVCAPTYSPQAAISFERTRQILGASLRVMPEGYHELATVPVITVGRARAVFLSASPDAHVAGHTASIALIADEAQDIDAAWFNRQFRPMAASTGAPCVLLGTPWNGQTLLETAAADNRQRDAKQVGRRGRDFCPAHHEVGWREVARSVPAYGAHVLAERNRLGAGHPLFRTQYELEAAEDEGRLFSPAQVAAFTGAHPRLHEPLPGERYAAGLDLAGEGPNADAVVLTIARISPPGPMQAATLRCDVVDHRRWRSRPFEEVIQGCIAAARAWHFERLCVDATGIGAPIAARLAEALRGMVQPVTFSAPVKSALGYELLAAANTGQLSLYSDDGTAESSDCRRELRDCRASFPPGGQLRWSAPPGQHDDFVASLALCFRAARESGAPRIALGRRPA